MPAASCPGFAYPCQINRGFQQSLRANLTEQDCAQVAHHEVDISSRPCDVGLACKALKTQIQRLFDQCGLSQWWLVACSQGLVPIRLKWTLATLAECNKKFLGNCRYLLPTPTRYFASAQQAARSMPSQMQF